MDAQEYTPLTSINFNLSLFQAHIRLQKHQFNNNNSKLYSIILMDKLENYNYKEE